MKNLTDRQLDTLKNKYLSGLPKRLSLLLELDIECRFNRRKLSSYLKKHKLYGYSPRQLKRLLGAPILTTTEFKLLNRMVEQGKIDSVLLRLIISKSLYRKIGELSNGSKE